MMTMMIIISTKIDWCKRQRRSWESARQRDTLEHAPRDHTMHCNMISLTQCNRLLNTILRDIIATLWQYTIAGCLSEKIYWTVSLWSGTSGAIHCPPESSALGACIQCNQMKFNVVIFYPFRWFMLHYAIVCVSSQKKSFDNLFQSRKKLSFFHKVIDNKQGIYQNNSQLARLWNWKKKTQQGVSAGGRCFPRHSDLRSL